MVLRHIVALSVVLIFVLHTLVSSAALLHPRRGTRTARPPPSLFLLLPHPMIIHARRRRRRPTERAVRCSAVSERTKSLDALTATATVPADHRGGGVVLDIGSVVEGIGHVTGSRMHAYERRRERERGQMERRERGKDVAFEAHAKIQKRLVAAQRPKEVLRLVEKHLEYFNDVNAITAVHRLAKMQKDKGFSIKKKSPTVRHTTDHQHRHPAREGGESALEQEVRSLTAAGMEAPTPAIVARNGSRGVSVDQLPENPTTGQLLESGVFQLLMERLDVAIDRCWWDARSAVNLAWSMASLQLPPSAMFEELLFGACHLHIDGMVPQGLANLAWVIAKTNTHSKELLEALGGRVIDLLSVADSEFEPRQLANIAWAFGHFTKEGALAPALRDRVFDSIAHEAILRLRRNQVFPAQALSSLLWGFSTAKIWCEELFDLASEHASALLPDMAPYGLVTLTKAYSKAIDIPEVRQYGGNQHDGREQAHWTSPTLIDDGSGMSLWASAPRRPEPLPRPADKRYPHAIHKLLSGVASEVKHRLSESPGSIAPVDIKDITWAFAAAGWKDRELYGCLAGACGPHLRRMATDHLVVLFRTMADVQLDDLRFFKTASSELRRRLQDLELKHLPYIIWAYGKLSLLDSGLISGVLPRVCANMAAYELHQLVMIAWGLACLRWKDEEFFRLLADLVVESSGQLQDNGGGPMPLKPAQQGLIAWAFAFSGVADDRLFSTLAAAVCEQSQLDEYTTWTLCLLLWSYVTLDLHRYYAQMITLVLAELDRRPLSEFSPRDVLQLVDALAKGGMRPESLLRGLVAKVRRDLAVYAITDLIFLLYGLVRLDLWDESIGQIVCFRATKAMQLKDTSPRALALLARTCTVVGYHQHDFLKAYFNRLVADVSAGACGDDDLSQSLGALRDLDTTQYGCVLDQLADAILERCKRKESDASVLANLAWTLHKCSMLGTGERADRMAQIALPILPHFTIQELSGLLVAYGRCSGPLAESLVDGIAMQAVERWPEVQSAGRAGVFISYLPRIAVSLSVTGGDPTRLPSFELFRLAADTLKASPTLVRGDRLPGVLDCLDYFGLIDQGWAESFMAAMTPHVSTLTFRDWAKILPRIVDLSSPQYLTHEADTLQAAPAVSPTGPQHGLLTAVGAWVGSLDLTASDTFAHPSRQWEREHPVSASELAAVLWPVLLVVDPREEGMDGVRRLIEMVVVRVHEVPSETIGRLTSAWRSRGLPRLRALSSGGE